MTFWRFSHGQDEAGDEEGGRRRLGVVPTQCGKCTISWKEEMNAAVFDIGGRGVCARHIVDGWGCGGRLRRVVADVDVFGFGVVWRGGEERGCVAVVGVG